jgi:thiol-disulfide isomerase/thioredoxin
MILAALFARFLPSALAADPTYALVQVGGADDDCCAQNVSVALQSLPFVTAAAVSVDGRACVALSGPADLAAMQVVLAPGGYTATAIEPVAACPAGLTPTRADPWANAAGLDVVVVSRGEQVDLAAALPKGKFTVVDFAAKWCGPCYPAAEKLSAYLRAHPDTAVRAVVLDGTDARVSFALPVVKQHLQWAEGLPYLRVYGPTGTSIYEGSDVDAAIAMIDRKRK